MMGAAMPNLTCSETVWRSDSSNFRCVKRFKANTPSALSAQPAPWHKSAAAQPNRHEHAGGFRLLYRPFQPQGPSPRAVQSVLCELHLSLIHISEPTRRTPISYAVFCLKKKNG